MTNSTMIDPRSRSAEDRKAIRAQIDKVNAEANDNWDDPQWRREMAAEMTETIYWGFQHENLLALMTTLENAQFNDRILIHEVRGLRAHWVARGGHIEASTMHKESMELPRDTIGFHVYEFEDKLRTNFAETQATLVELGIQRMDAEVNKRFLRLLQAAVPQGSDQYISGGGVTLAALNLALREVRETSYSRDVAIIGRPTMTEQIMDVILGPNGNGQGFLPNTNEELFNRGVIGSYRGARIVSLTNWRDDTDTSFFPANEMFVVGTDASKCAFWGGLMSKEYVEQDNWYWHYLARRDFGGIVHRPDRLRRIVDTNTAP
jgi:hypothetical protein